jgi:phosphatidate cytidylyltransferase
MKRIVTALLLLPVVTYVILWAPFLAFAVVLAAIAIVCFWEYEGIVAGHGIERAGPVGFGAGLLVLFAPFRGTTGPVLIALIAITMALGARDLKQALPRASALVFGVLYVFGSWHCAIDLRALSPAWLFFAIALNWVGDTAAMYVGRSLGRHKLAPRISPGKSWEGSVASVVGSVAFGLVFVHYVLPAVPLWLAGSLALSGNIAGQIGDLAESAMKRGANKKDSGTMLPGHGGWLDRLDSSLFSVPVVYALLLAAGRMG